MKLALSEEYVKDLWKHRHVSEEQIKFLTLLYNSSYYDLDTLCECFIYTGRATLNNFKTKGRIDYRGLILDENDPINIANTVSILRSFKFETVRYILVKNSRVVAQYGITTRSSGSVPIIFHKKDFRGTCAEILYKFKRYNADGLYIMHNHPSGGSKPSQADANTTYHLLVTLESLRKQFGIDNILNIFKGHLIVGAKDLVILKPTDETFTHFKSNSIPIEYTESFDIEIPHDVLLHTVTDYNLNKDPEILSLGSDDKMTTILYCNRFTDTHKLTVVAIQEIDNYEFDVDGVWRHIEKEQQLNDAIDCILVTSDKHVYDKSLHNSTIVYSLLVSGNGSLISSSSVNKVTTR